MGPPPSLVLKHLVHSVELAVVCAAQSTVSAVSGEFGSLFVSVPSDVHQSICGTNKISRSTFRKVALFNKKINH